MLVEMVKLRKENEGAPLTKILGMWSVCIGKKHKATMSVSSFIQVGLSMNANF